MRTLLLALIGIATPLALLAQERAIPAPATVLGHEVGESGHLADWALINSYFEELAQASPLVRLEQIGTSALGRPMIMAVITSQANQARIEEIRGAQAILADPRRAGAAAIDALIAAQPAVAFIGASLHGNEIMATQMSMELAYGLASDPELSQSLDNVVVLLVPGMNPDGLDITRDWWLRTRNTEHAGTSLPWLYHHYTGHDNNRDFFMVTQPETEAVTRVLYERWFPQVVYDVHQMGNGGARFFIPPFGDPLNPNIDPLLVRMTNLVGVDMALALTEAGKTGVSHQARYDLWWHGGARTVPARHNMVGILSEAASANYGDSVTQDPEELNQPERGSMYPERWEGTEWRPRDIVEYELIAAKSLVELLDRRRVEFIGNFVELARRQIEAGRAGGPFAYVLPASQRDPGSMAEMLRVLRKGGVEVHRAGSAFTAGGREFAAGSFSVLMAQPYRAHAKDLLEAQHYPDRRLYPGGPPAPPYDLAGWTLPMQMGVDVVEIVEAFDTGALTTVDRIETPPGRFFAIDGRAAGLALRPAHNNIHRAVHETLQAGGTVVFTDEPIDTAARQAPAEWPAGTPVVTGLEDLEDRARRWSDEWGLDVLALGTIPQGRPMDQLRVGLYKPWTASIDEGWTRWVFEQWAVPFDTIHDDRIRQGDLLEEFDAIVLPSLGYRQILEGSSRAHPDFAGGIGAAGATALRRFVEEGGTLVLLDDATEFATEQLGIPVRNILEDQDDDDPDAWYAPGSLLRVEWARDHPVATGMPDEGAIFYARSAVFEVDAAAPGISIIARYPESDILMSGYAQGEERIAGRAAALEAVVGAGRVVLFGFRPQHRAQPHLTFKPFFNALYQR
ncbi:MAG: M14 metallopeptidase family protein [Gemmatimonadota bacterium]